jgi:type II secretory pathway predicted ATPase ExeA
MARFFNTAGPCRPEDHYMLPPERRLPGVRELLERKQYFAIHAPRQSGKTTIVQDLAGKLNEEGSYAAVCATCERGQTAREDVDRGVRAVLRAIEGQAARLPEELRPEPLEQVETIEADSRLAVYLERWSRRCALPVVLFLDEIDALLDDALLSVLRQLRSGYPDRPGAFPQSVALIGLRDVRDYRTRVRPEAASLGTSSPFNIKVESFSLRNFTAEEVAELYEQHTADTGQVFTAEAKALAWELTRGQPWLVNAVARQAVDVLVRGRSLPVEAHHVERAKEILIERRDTHIDSLVDRLREPRVQRVLEPLVSGEFLPPDVLDDDIQFVKDLGLVAPGSAGLEIANPIYREIIPRALTAVLQESLPVARAAFLAPDGTLRFNKLLDDFRSFWCQHAEFFVSRQPYPEAAAQLIFMAFLQRVVNGGGSIDREYAVGSGRIDLCVRWPHPGGIQRWAIELKVWREGRPDPLAEGLDQLTGYLARLGLDQGILVLFDSRTQASPVPERCSRAEQDHEGRKITVLRL